MKTFFRIFTFARPVEKYAIPYFFCVVLHAVFNTLTFTLIMPVLTTLFNGEAMRQAVTVMPEFQLSTEYLENIKYYCLIMSAEYIRNHFADIRRYASAIENRLEDECCTMEKVLADNEKMLSLAQEYKANCILIEDRYEINIDL